METIQFKPIGVIHTPFNEPKDTPRSSAMGEGAEGTIELYPEYLQGLTDLEGFSHLEVVFYLHRSADYKLMVIPPLDDRPHGLFATRSPHRPNPVGISIVRLVRIEGITLHIADLDMLDGTPLLDIKPYVPRRSKDTNIRIGWLEDKIDKDKR
ncbi:MAG: tRNA (N6-threonylcarbamoyladenosine(37)-N6)-methyltransferase TrmO [candidate division Zixibacteria bacterium HGW-Zixibacteria-1]|nr:MAG: tRNA (N6-threonylcarbamoyladenosine(37)-N6)-methyltransferase TrmO [candidate division Zixibacteria bacterium HGW-Zixibacteria-1]